MTQESDALSIADAVMILALVHFMDERAYCREEVTEKAANKIAALTSAVSCMPVHPLAELGVYVRRGVVMHVPEAVLLHACALVLRHRAHEWARAVVAPCKGQSVAVVEQLEVRVQSKARR